MHLETVELRGLGRLAEVAPDHVAVLGQHAGGRGAGPREPDHEVGALRQRRPGLHRIDCWYSVKPIAAEIAAMIQKRRMIFVSDQAISSKW